MIHKILQFALYIAFCCILHHVRSRDIHCWKYVRSEIYMGLYMVPRQRRWLTIISRKCQVWISCRILIRIIAVGATFLSLEERQGDAPNGRARGKQLSIEHALSNSSHFPHVSEKAIMCTPAVRHKTEDLWSDITSPPPGWLIPSTVSLTKALRLPFCPRAL